MASTRAVALADRISWALIYGGLFAVVVGFITGSVHFTAGWSLGVFGGIAVAAGIVLIWVRSRMSVGPPASAQSTSDPGGNP